MIIFKENYIILIFQANTQPISWSFPRKYMTHVIKNTLHTKSIKTTFEEYMIHLIKIETNIDNT
jgi:hypothetical protein